MQMSRYLAFVTGQIGDQRRHRRIPVGMPLRYLDADGGEYKATLGDMSPGGVSIVANERPQEGSTIVAYVEDIGRIEGRVVRHHDSGFCIHLNAGQHRRERIVERLTFYANRHWLKAEDLRAHERVELDREARCVFADGSEQACRVVDLSLSGAAIAIAPRPGLGAEVVIGRMRGRVVRHLPNGVAIQFLDLALSHSGAAEKLTRH